MKEIKLGDDSVLIEQGDKVPLNPGTYKLVVKTKAELFVTRVCGLVPKWLNYKWYKFILKKRRADKATLEDIRTRLEEVGYQLMNYNDRCIWDYNLPMNHIMMALSHVQDLDEDQLNQLKEMEGMF